MIPPLPRLLEQTDDANEPIRGRPSTSQNQTWTRRSRGITVVLAVLWLLAATYLLTRELHRDEAHEADEGPGDSVDESAIGGSEYVGDERSTEEVEARGETDADATPAEPGEMVVDEGEVDEEADEVVEEDPEPDAE